MKSNRYFKKPNFQKKNAINVKEPEFPKTLNNTYLGQKGYTIPKSDLTIEQLELLKQMLMVKPCVMGAGALFTFGTDPVFPVYRESNKKIYIPRFFGENHFGIAKTNQLTSGEDIDTPFAGSLRSNQIPVVKTFMENADKGGGLLELPCAFGKTTISLNIISQLKKKTLVIVNKEFLLNQWVDRISQFLPTARVGRIQGQVVDIENKDIVIGMLQSLSMKDYPTETFVSFGLTIIDEVHHISSEVFSRALFKIVTKYMLGLSATMERKDGTTHIFKMFLGEVVFKGDRDEDFPVCVRAITYKSEDPVFNNVEVDFRGNPKYSTMIVKLCEYNRRSDFIVRIIKDLINEQPDKQIMILCHNRSLLTYLHDAIEYRKIATVGFYVGGMKQSSLQETETRLIVLATYAMAAEALDIKTLSTLVMVTPKTDIVQSVGRILRVRHEKPIVVDIVDTHDLFQNQWAQRRRFYKKCNYRIRQIDSDKYNDMLLDWETDTTWKRVYEPKKILDKGLNSEDEEENGKKTLGKCLIQLEED